MSETLMTEANQTNEGDTQQPVDATTEQSTEATTDTQQQAETVQDQQVSDETTVESKTSESEAPEGAPEKYEFNPKVADAPNELDPEVLTAFGDVAKELNLPQEAAQKVLDKVAPVIQARQAKAIEQQKLSGLINQNLMKNLVVKVLQKTWMLLKHHSILLVLML